MISSICAEFGCTPSEAAAEDFLTVQAVIEFRRAKTAIDLFNSGEKGFEQLSKRPDLTALLLEIAKAQDGGAELDDVYRTLREQHPEDEEDD